MYDDRRPPPQYRSRSRDRGYAPPPYGVPPPPRPFDTPYDPRDMRRDAMYDRRPDPRRDDRGPPPPPAYGAAPYRGRY